MNGLGWLRSERNTGWQRVMISRLWDGMGWYVWKEDRANDLLGRGGGGDADADAGVECCVGGLGLLGLVPVLLREDVGDGIMRLS